jgi:hypothetical protein
MKSLDIRPAGSSPKRPFLKKAPISAPEKTEKFPSFRVQRVPKQAMPNLMGAVVRKKIPKTATTVVGIALLVLGLISFFVLPEARIQVTLRSEPATRDFQIHVDKSQTQVDASNLAVPAKYLEQEISGTKTFIPTGARNVGKTASGFVYIYNFAKTPLILKAQTTTLTANGHQYFFTQDVANIRPTALIGLDNPEVDPTSLIPPVPVVASGPGGEYNLPKGSRIEISNEAFGSQPKLLYAVVAEDVAGGTNQQVKIVTAGDVAASYAAVTKDLVDGARQVLVTQNPDAKLLDNAATADVLEQKTSVPAGTQADQFEATVKIKLRGLAYNDADIRDIIMQRIERLLPANKVLKKDQSTSVASNFTFVNIDQGQGTLAAHFEGEVVYRVDPQELTERVKGKNAAEIKEILLSRPEIQSAEVRFYPFWVKKAPTFSSKIYFDVQQPAT